MTSNSKTVAAHTSPKSSRASTLSRHGRHNGNGTRHAPTHGREPSSVTTVTTVTRGMPLFRQTF